MSTLEKLWSVDQIKALLKDSPWVKVAGVDMDGILRGKTMSRQKFLSSTKSGFGHCSIVFGWDMNDKSYTTSTAFSSEVNGNADVWIKVDLNSHRPLIWENGMPLFLCTFHDPHGSDLPALPVCPRSLLARICDHGEQGLGIKAYAGVEYEFFNYQETPKSLEEKAGTGLIPATPGMFGYSILRPNLYQDYMDELLKFTREMDVPIESIHTETGPGVLETALSYGPVRSMGDQTVLFKYIAKATGLRHGLISSFMAKPCKGLPGSSGHAHLSLRGTGDREGEGTLFGSDPQGPHGLTPTMAHFLAGVLRGLPSILSILAPTINSYKRLVENYFAPVTLTWGHENRQAAIRVILEPANSSRMEVRVPGADSTGPLVLAAILGCGLKGIEERWIPPPPAKGCSTKDESGKPYERLANTLRESLALTNAPDSMARQVLGDGFVDHWVATREHELREWEQSVTNWEVKRYLELV
ncbi:MAG: hypothetical protein DHS80DRAFT_33275 [Piptocephalis tieghemiana]|nr:MAG: hypothetical protein DHS80DRAFT_33275 [Piptocephalis tieghemiana]